MKRNTEEISCDEIRGMRDVLRELINQSSLEFVLKLSIDVEMEESNKLFNEHKQRQSNADLFSRKLNSH